MHGGRQDASFLHVDLVLQAPPGRTPEGALSGGGRRPAGGNMD